MLPTRFQGQAGPRVDDHLGARLHMDLLTGHDLKHLPGAVNAVAGHGEVVVAQQLHLALARDVVMLVGIELAVATAMDLAALLVTDFEGVVMLDLGQQVAFGVYINVFRTLAVFDAQFIGATASRRAEGFEDTSGFMRRQLVRHGVGFVMQRAMQNRPVAIPLQE